MKIQMMNMDILMTTSILMNIRKISFLSKVFLIVNFILLIGLFLFDSSNHNSIVNGDFYLILLWIIGVLNFSFNLFFLIKIKIKKIFYIILVISGISLIFPFLLITFFGFPLLILYFLFSFYFQFIFKKNFN